VVSHDHPATIRAARALLGVVSARFGRQGHLSRSTPSPGWSGRSGPATQHDYGGAEALAKGWWTSFLPMTGRVKVSVGHSEKLIEPIRKYTNIQFQYVTTGELSSIRATEPFAIN